MKTILIDAVNTFVIRGEGVDKKMYEVLGQFPNKKIILSNANDEQVVAFGLIDLPYELFTLKHNPEKSDQAYFVTMLAHFGLDSSQVVYFEHNLDAVKSAQSVGILTHHYSPVLRDLASVEAFLTENL